MQYNPLANRFSELKAIRLSFLLVVFNSVAISFFAQPANDKCETATNLPVEEYAYYFYCLEGSLDGADPDTLNDEPFDVSAFPTVWYSFSINNWPSVVNIHFRSEEIEWPVLRLFRKGSSCEDLVPFYPDELNPEKTWLEGVDGKAEWIGLELGGGEYLLALTGIDAGEGTYTLCINEMSQLTPYFQMKAKTPQVEWRQYSGPLDGPFFQGENLFISTTVGQRADAFGSCNWFQGLVPVFGQSWAYDNYLDRSDNSFIDDLPCGQAGNGKFGASTWDWFEDDVYYHQSSDHLVTGYFEDQLIFTTGLKSIYYDPFVPDHAESIFGGCCFPCWNAELGTALPPGWFCYGNNGHCSIPGPPIRYDWGDGESCSPTTAEWTFTQYLRVSDDIEDCENVGPIDLTLAMTPLMENVIGAWTDNIEGLYDPYGFIRLRVDCAMPVEFEIIQPDTVIQVCISDSIVLPLQDLYGQLEDIAFWKYNINGPSGTSPFAGFTTKDTLTFIPQQVSGNVILYSGWIQAFADARRMVGQYYVQFIFYRRAPIANIVWEIKNGDVHFSQTTPVVELTDILWDFGDSTTSTQLKPIHTYDKEGKYLVTLIVTNPCGADTIQEEILFIENLPVPDFTISDHTLCIFDTVRYTSLSTGYIDSLVWQFEGGIPGYSKDSIVEVIYPETGVFDVTLTAFNALGNPDKWIEDTIEVFERPEAEYSISVYNTVFYCIYNGDTSNVVTWQFEEGELVYNDTLTLTLEKSGAYPVKLWVENGCGRDSVFFDLDVIITSTHVDDQDAMILIYPNPTEGSIWLITEHFTIPARIHIYDLAGRLVWSQWMSNKPVSPLEIPLNKMGVAAGTYYLEVYQDSKRTVQQFVKL